MLTVPIYLLHPGPAGLADNILYDFCLRHANSDSASASVINEKKVDTGRSYASVIVDIDEYSLTRFGQWPWPRYHLAALLKKIENAGAAAIGIDILIAEADRTSPVTIQKRFRKDFDLDVNFNDLPVELMDNDLMLAGAVKESDAVAGCYFNFDLKDEMDEQSDEISRSPAVSTPSSLDELSATIEFEPGSDPDSLSDPGSLFGSLFEATGAVAPLQVLLDTPEETGNGKNIDSDKKIGSNKMISSGFMNILSDADGVLRRIPLLISWQRSIYPQLALAAVLNSQIHSSGSHYVEPVIRVSSGDIQSLSINDTIEIPLDRHGSMLLNYRGPSHSFRYISAGRILENSVPESELNGKIVFVGSSAAGLKDLRVTPFDNNFPGVEVHATIAENILNRDFISRPQWAEDLEIIMTLVAGIIATVLTVSSGPAIASAAVFAVGVSLFLAGITALRNHHIWLSPLFPLIALAVNFIILNLSRYIISEKEKKFYRTAFGRYVSESVVNQIIESPEKLNLEGEEKEMTILFSDIRSFSSISEKLSPSQVSRLLQDYFTPLTGIITARQGTLDKFIGDALMCFWNAPLDVENHRELALKAAMEALSTIENMSTHFDNEYKVHIQTGFGLHSGICSVGNMGSADLFDYTVIGDNVNTASRLEGLTKFYGVDLIFSDTMLPDDDESRRHLQYVDRVRVKGKNEPVDIYTADWRDSFWNCGGKYEGNGLPILTENDLLQYHQAIELYKKRDFGSACPIFAELEKRCDCRSRLFSIYRDRSYYFMRYAPDMSWDGVYNHTSK